jgi:DNA-binding response OmpR family regulator
MSGEKILIVDDNLTNLQVLVQALDGKGHELLIAQSGEEALQTARSAHPALILLDIMMPPGIDGFEVIKRLKADDETKDSVVIFLSAKDDVPDKIKGFELGAADYISKPFQIEEVLVRVDTHVKAFQKMKSLADETQRLSDLNSEELSNDAVLELIKNGESEKVEFKSTIRWNLKADKQDKNIEIAWLKGLVGFLNTNGGHMLIGVNDDGGLIDIVKTDRFPNEDKTLLNVNNLIKSHIGLEYSPFINTECFQFEDKSIIVIFCKRSTTPAFLELNDEENFFIRLGPSSRKLSTRATIEYLKAHPFDEPLF